MNNIKKIINNNKKNNDLKKYIQELKIITSGIDIIVDLSDKELVNDQFKHLCFLEKDYASSEPMNLISLYFESSFILIFHDDLIEFTNTQIPPFLAKDIHEKSTDLAHCEINGSHKFILKEKGESRQKLEKLLYNPFVLYPIIREGIKKALEMCIKYPENSPFFNTDVFINKRFKTLITHINQNNIEDFIEKPQNIEFGVKDVLYYYYFYSLITVCCSYSLHACLDKFF